MSIVSIQLQKPCVLLAFPGPAPPRDGSYLAAPCSASSIKMLSNSPVTYWAQHFSISPLSNSIVADLYFENRLSPARISWLTLFKD